MKLELIITFFLGTIFGSFFYTLALRFLSPEYKNESFKKLISRSKCQTCGQSINPLLMVPVFGYLLARGKCGKCKAKISFLYPIFEIIYGLLFVVFLMKYGIGIYTFFIFLMFSVVVTLSIIDFKTQTIPNSLVITLFVLSIYPMISNHDFKNNLYGLILMSLFFIVILFIFPGSFGGGDVKLAAVIGLFSGLELSIIIIEVALISGTLSGVLYAVIKKKSLKTKIPFAPFLGFGFFISLLYGNELFLIYSNKFFN